MSEQAQDLSNEATVENETVEETLGLQAAEVSQDEELSEEVEVVAETEEELKEEIEDAIDNGATKEEVKSMIREFELKVNGKTFNKKIDLSDEEAVKRELQKAYAGQMAMQQKAELEKSLEERVGLWKKNPSSMFKDLNMDVEEYLNSYMEEKLEESKKTPEQLEREQIQKELTEARRREKQLAERIKSAEYERLQEQAAKELNDDITSALDAHSDLPKSPRVVAKIADTMQWALNNGFDDVTAADVMPTVKKEIESEIQDMFEGMPLEVIEAYIGKKTFDRFREDKLKKVQKKAKTLNEIKKEVTSPKAKIKEDSRKRGRLDDFMRNRG